MPSRPATPSGDSVPFLAVGGTRRVGAGRGPSAPTGNAQPPPASSRTFSFATLLRSVSGRGNRTGSGSQRTASGKMAEDTSHQGAGVPAHNASRQQPTATVVPRSTTHGSSPEPGAQAPSAFPNLFARRPPLSTSPTPSTSSSLHGSTGPSSQGVRVHRTPVHLKGHPPANLHPPPHHPPSANGPHAHAHPHPVNRRVTPPPRPSTWHKPPGPAGPFVRYVLTPLVILPVAWPWFVLRAAHVGMVLLGLYIGVGVDLLLVVAGLVGRNRAALEALAAWILGWMSWGVSCYWAALGSLHQGCEDALSQLLSLLLPLVSAALRRYPLVATLLSPAFATAAVLQDVLYGLYCRAEWLYCLLHDEIVPVALDLAERLPLVPHGLLHRVMTG